MSNELRRSCTTHSVFSRSKIQSQKPINQCAVRFERIQIKTCVCIQCIICVLAECWFERQHPSVRIFAYGGTEADAGFGLKHQTKYNAVFAAARRINIQCRFGFVKHVSPVRKHHPNAERADSKDSRAAAALYSHAWLHCICGNRAVSRSRCAARQALRRSAAHVCKILLMGGTY